MAEEPGPVCDTRPPVTMQFAEREWFPTRLLAHEDKSPMRPPVWTQKTMPGHTGGMSVTEKIAVSLPRGMADRARRAVRQGHAASVSAYVAAALEEKAKLDELATLLDEMLAESGGPLSASERRAADRALRGPTAHRRR